MLKAIDVLYYTYFHDVLCSSLITNAVVLDSDPNLAFTAARVISVQEDLKTNDDWRELKFMADPLCMEISRHVALHSFIPHNGLICVPTPGLSIQHNPIEIQLDAIELKKRHTLAEQNNCIAYGLEGRRSPFSGALHSDPDYAVISFRNYDLHQSYGESLYYGCFCGPNEKWNYYTVPELPSNINFSKVKGIIFSGGKYSAAPRETVEWMPRVKRFIRRIYSAFPNIKLFGHCLGAQLLAASLGGAVDKDPVQHFILGNETVKLTSAGQEELKGLPIEFKISELHSDYIQSLPRDGVLYGSSESCAVEVWGVPGRVLGLQGHVEYSTYALTHFLAMYLYNSGDVTKQHAKRAMREASLLGSYDLAVVKALNCWLKA